MAILTPYQVDPSLLANSFNTGARLGVATPNLGTALIQGASAGYQTSISNEAEKARTELFKQQSAQIAVENVLKVKELENYDMNNKIQQNYTKAQTLKINSDKKVQEFEYEQAVKQEAEYNSFISKAREYINAGNVEAGVNLFNSPTGAKFADENPTWFKTAMKSFQSIAELQGNTKALASLGKVNASVQNKKDIAQYNSLKDSRSILDSQLNRDNILPGSIVTVIDKEPISLSPQSLEQLNGIPKEQRQSFFDPEQIKVSTTDRSIKVTSKANENLALEFPRATPTEDPLENSDYKVLSSLWRQNEEMNALSKRMNFKAQDPLKSSRGKISTDLEQILEKIKQEPQEGSSKKDVNYAEGLNFKETKKETFFSRMGFTSPTIIQGVGDKFDNVLSSALGVDINTLKKPIPLSSNSYDRENKSPYDSLKRSIEEGTPLKQKALEETAKRLVESDYNRLAKEKPELLKNLDFEDYQDIYSPEVKQRILEFIEDSRTALRDQANNPGNPTIIKKNIEKREVLNASRELLKTFRENKQKEQEEESFYLQDLGDTLRKVESSSTPGSRNYSARSPSGLAVGAYQFQPLRLKELGVLKSVTKGGRVSDLENPDNWNIEGGLDTFLKNGRIQDAVYIQHMKKNREDLQKLGLINENTPENVVKGMLMAKHLMSTKANFFLKDLKKSNFDLAKVSKKYNGKDANDTSLLEYFLVGAEGIELAEAKQVVRSLRG